ncbi:MAG: discoidin domain-containing protein, partial [Pontiellaceae bacterium]|nr:discoidin domain-containing protein [Pontiellaceae bacterium]
MNRISRIIATGMLVSGLSGLQAHAQTNLALGKTATASSAENDGYLAASGVTDGNLETRWGSGFSDDEWMQVDLGASMTIGRVLLRWEAAYATAYTIQISDDAEIWTDLRTVSQGYGGIDDLAVAGTGRYVRMQGVTRFTGYGYSLWEFEVYTDPPPDGPPVQTTNQTVSLNFPVQGLAYAKVTVSPEPLSVSPTPSEGTTTPSVLNPTEPVTYLLTFPANTTVTIAKNQFSGSVPGTDIELATMDYAGTPLQGRSVTALARDGADWNVVVVSDNAGGGNTDHPPENWIADPYTAPVPPPEEGDFDLVGPAPGSLLTDTRRPTLEWDPVNGATEYRIFVNLSRTDYDWMAPGRLLDRYTEVAVVSGATAYQLTEDLPDRWTYQWYVVATNGDGDSRQSDVGRFAVYVPELTGVNDGVAVIDGCRDLNKNGTIEPYEDWHNLPAVRTADLVSRMTRQQKAMQLFFNTQLYPEAGFGFGPFSLNDLMTYQMAAGQTDLGIPNIVMGDTIHGYKTVFPTQPALAATRDMQIAWEVADMQRRESLAVGTRGTLSPLAEVGTKVLYPRIQEGCGEDADLAAGMVRAMVVGLQGGPEVCPDSMMITTKHWASQGAGGESGLVYDGTTIWYHMRPWHAAIEAGSSSIMPGYSGSWLLATEGYGAGDDPGILGFLREEMGYNGVICTDWLPSGAWTRACSNGADVMGGADPAAMGTFADDVPLARLDDAVTRVLDLKFRLGLFENPYGPNPAQTSELHAAEKVEIVHRAAVKAVTLLKNDGPLPLRIPAGGSIVVDGPRADDPSCMVTWRSDFHETEFGSKTIYRAIVDRAEEEGVTVYSPSAREATAVPVGVTPSVAVVVVGESYYTHGTFWDKDSPYLPDDPIGPEHDMEDAPQYSLIARYRDAGIPVVVICMLPRPYVLTNVAAASDALMVVYRPGDEGGTAIAETLFGDYLPSGKLPWQLPRSTDQVGIDDSGNYLDQPDVWDLPFDMGATEAELAEIRAAIAAGEHVEPIYGDPLYQYGAGLDGFGLVDATPPSAFNLLTPGDGAVIDGALPEFVWEASQDPESGIRAYQVVIDGVMVADSLEEASYQLSGASIGNGAHSWYVQAVNWAGAETVSSTNRFTISDTIPPAAFALLQPVDGVEVDDPSQVSFVWEQSSDQGTGVARYDVLVNGTAVASVVPSVPVDLTANLARGKAVTVSSTNDGSPGAAVDGDEGTRWGSSWDVADPDREWICVDLGAIYSIRKVVVDWENAYGKRYEIQVSMDGSTWTTIHQESAGAPGVNTHDNLSGAGRYIRMQGVERGTGYGYSMWEFEVYGRGTEQVTAPLPISDTHAWKVRAVDGAGNAVESAAFDLRSSLSALQQWRLLHFQSLEADDAVAGNAAMPMNDGVPNILKYAVGMDPEDAASGSELSLGTISND